MYPRQTGDGKYPPPAYRQRYQQDVPQTAQEEPEEQENQNYCDTDGEQRVCLDLGGVGDGDDRGTGETDVERSQETGVRSQETGHAIGLNFQHLQQLFVRGRFAAAKRRV